MRTSGANPEYLRLKRPACVYSFSNASAVPLEKKQLAVEGEMLLMMTSEEEEMLLMKLEEGERRHQHNTHKTHSFHILQHQAQQEANQQHCNLHLHLHLQDTYHTHMYHRTNAVDTHAQYTIQAVEEMVVMTQKEGEMEIRDTIGPPECNKNIL